jgi:hypothetical protein
MRLGVLFALVAATAAVLVPGLASGARADDFGTLTLCNGIGNPPVRTVIVFSLTGRIADGGTQTFTLDPGACKGKYFYLVGSTVTAVENVPTGASVSAITLTGGSSTLTQSVLGGGVATITMGTGDSTITFTTKASGPAALRDCVVPKVVGLTLSAARNAIKRAACRVKSVTYVHSTRIPKGGVTSTKPKRGTHLAHNGRVRVYVSRGR